MLRLTLYDFERYINAAAYMMKPSVSLRSGVAVGLRPGDRALSRLLNLKLLCFLLIVKTLCFSILEIFEFMRLNEFIWASIFVKLLWSFGIFLGKGSWPFCSSSIQVTLNCEPYLCSFFFGPTLSGDMLK